jgi:hypothetical protein
MAKTQKACKFTHHPRLKFCPAHSHGKGKALPRSEFGRKKNNYGLQPYCRACNARTHRVRRKMQGWQALLHDPGTLARVVHTIMTQKDIE